MTTQQVRPEIIERLFLGVLPSFAMVAGMKLDLFTPLGDGPKNAEQIAGAVQSLHAKGIVHRWIAPESILIDESSQTAVLTGFTFAKPMDLQGLSTFHKQDSRTESMPSYIAPEQVAGLPADARRVRRSVISRC